MKFSRMLAVGAAAAFVGVSTLAVGGTASAADFYVDDSQIGFVPDGSPYLDSWFSGDVSGPDQGTATSTVAGLEMTAAPTGYQLLNGDVPVTTGLEALLAGAGFTMSSGDAAFQVPMFFEDDLDADTNPEFTTLRPAGYNTLTGNWMSSSNIMANDGVTVVFAANTEYALADMLAAMPDYEILAFGIFANTDATVASITWGGNTHWFLPAPSATISARSITVADFASTGVTAVLSGFIPGENVQTGYGNGAMGDFLGTVVADANGSVTIHFTTASASTAAGVTYTIGGGGDLSGAFASTSFALIANPAVLAATGADFTPAIASGGVLMLLGAGLVVAGRRRKAAHRG